MLHRCKSCSYETSAGILPTCSCGMLLVPPVALALAVTIGVTKIAWASWGYLAFLVPVPLFLVTSVPLIVIFNCTLEFIDWVVALLKRCPKCHRRRWSWGYTRGFGL